MSDCPPAPELLVAFLRSSEEKLEAAALLAETLTQTWVADEKKKEHRQKVQLGLEFHSIPGYPISEERLAAKQEIKAVANVLSLNGVTWLPPFLNIP